MAARDDVQRLAAALERPRAGYLAALERARVAMAARSGEAARQLGVFLDRVGDLTGDELRELYDETFHERTPMAAFAAQLARQGGSQAGDMQALAALTPWLDRLDAERNPFACVVRALCCLLLARAKRSRLGQSANDVV